MTRKKNARPRSCFTKMAWFILIASVLLLTALFGITAIYDLGVWDEFWALF